MNSKWFYDTLDKNGSDLISSVINSKGTHNLINKEEDTQAFLVFISENMISDDSYISLSRRDIHNIKQVRIINSRLDIDRAMGKITIRLLNDSNEYQNILEFDNDQFLTDDYTWED